MEVSRKKKKAAGINTASMADIAFLLLIFFMLSSVTDAEKEIPLELPRAKAPIQEKEKYFNIYVNKEGQIFFGEGTGNRAQLARYVSRKITTNPEMRALIRADQNVPYEYVNEVLEGLKEAGLFFVVFVSKKEGSA